MNAAASPQDEQVTKTIFKSVGICHLVPESQMNAFTGLSGSGPAFVSWLVLCVLLLVIYISVGNQVYMAIEALSDGAVKMGIPRQLATLYAAQMVHGSAKMVLESNRHPGSLKDDVCSPGGTTIAGVHALERAGFRYSSYHNVV